MWVNVFISLVSVQSWSRVTGSYRKVIVNVSQVAQTVKNVPAMQDTQVRSLGQEDPLEEEMATHSSILAWKSLPGSTVHGIARVRHDLVIKPPPILKFVQLFLLLRMVSPATYVSLNILNFACSINSNKWKDTAWFFCDD